jgi:peptidoglycan/LPS O-acetylase OafA/YrhL
MTAAFLHGLHPETITSVVPGGWSVADEVLFYCIFPLLAASISTWLRAAVLALLVAVFFYLFARVKTLLTILRFNRLAKRIGGPTDESEFVLV